MIGMDGGIFQSDCGAPTVADDVPALDLESPANGFQFADETRDPPVRGIARMVGHAAVELVVKNYRALVGKRRQSSETRMRCAGPAVDENHGRTRRLEVAVDANPYATTLDRDHQFAFGQRPGARSGCLHRLSGQNRRR